MTSVPLSEAKDRLSALVDSVESTHDIISITKHGRPAAVLIAQDDLDSLHETIFWLSQPGFLEDAEALRKGEFDGPTVSGTELRRQYGLDG